MPMNQMGYGPKTNTTGLFPISLQTGQSWVIPSGQYIVQLGPYTVIQTFDAVTQTWRIVQTPANSDIIQISSDGYNWRVINITGTVVGAYVVNGGQLLRRWTNDTLLATPHRAINRSGGERYALAFFCDATIDWPIAAVPTTVGPDRPPKYPTTYYTDYMVEYQKRTYDLLADQQAAE